MSKIAFIFPGQGAQAVGMGRALLEYGGAVAAVFAEADRVLGFPLGNILWQGPQETLTATENAQPALVTTAMAALTLVREKTGLQPDYVAGHSLGEYAAICAAGGLSFADALTLVRRRGMAMQSAVVPGQGAMAAMLTMERQTVEEVCQQAAGETGLVCVAANYNSPAQIVISGHKTAVERALVLARERGGKRCLMLEVSGAFHCPLMQPAAVAMQQALQEMPVADLAIPLVANVTARPVLRGDEVSGLLIRQITGAVRWEESIRYLAEQGVETFVELGTGKVLTGLLKRIAPGLQGVAINTPEDLTQLG